MTKIRGWPVRAMYMLIAAALVISLIITVAPAREVSADPGLSEWTRVDTPTTDGWVLTPDSIIIDYALAEAGEVAYAIVSQWDVKCPDPCYDDLIGILQGSGDYYLLKSDDHAATWDDITDALEDELDLEGTYFELLQVATDWEDPDFVAVALDIPDNTVYVAFSTDGGATFIDAGEVEDDVSLVLVADLAVSPETAGKREIAIGGQDDSDNAALFRCTVTGDSASAWEDATDYDGWDDDGDFDSEFVTDIVFSPSWATDKTILVTCYDDADDSIVMPIDDGDVYLQSGSWGTSPGWNVKSTLGIEAVPILEDVELPTNFFPWYPGAISGITLPEDYNGKNSVDRVLWVWVNYLNGADNAACAIMRVDDDSADPVGPMGQVEDGEVWLTNVSYHGTIAEGEALASVLGSGTAYAGYLVFAECCEGVQVYRNDGIRNMDICCERWHDACKPPTGKVAMSVSYVGDDKAYAVALLGELPYDEGAWSWTFDDGDTWNQLSLVDTWIDQFTDVAKSPDCNKTFLVSVNLEYIPDTPCGFCGCDSVWLYAEELPEAEEYSGKWLRTWCDQLGKEQWGLLRLAPEETTGDNVYLVDYGTSNVYWNDLETLACWDPIGSTVLENIVDLAAQDSDTLFALDADGDVAMFDDDEWQEDVASEVAAGWTIAVWGDWVLVGGRDGEVSYSDDGGETFTQLDDVYDGDSKVTVAFDTYFDQNDTIYAAVEAWGGDPYKHGGIYSLVIGADDEGWTDLKAEPLESQVGVDDGDGKDETVAVAFTGLVVDRPGNPFTDADNGGVIYATYYGSVTSVVGNTTVETWFTGVARSLERMVTVCTTCLAWDFLHVGLTPGEDFCEIHPEVFEAEPDALKICGCLTPDSNTHLFAIDAAWWRYDLCDNDFGSVWTYEDCYAKKAPEISSPVDGTVIPADPCSCYSVPFTIMWDALCDACSYDIAFAMDEDFDMPVPVNGEDDMTYHLEEQDVPAFSVLGGELGGLSCEMTYYVRVRAADAATGEIIHSWWSDPIEITIAPSTAAGQIALVSPEPGATGVAVEGVGFSWDLMATADSFDWVLDDNSDLSSPVESKTGLTSKAYECTQELEYDTTYYWMVTAYNEGSAISMSSVGTFRTMMEAEEPTPPPPVETPVWVWVIIGIGAALVIVVIVLIFRTRRV